MSDRMSNGFDPATVRDLVRKIEGCFAELLSERGAYMQRCKGVRQRIKGIYEEAKAGDIPKKELRMLLKQRELERRIENSIAELEADERENFEMLAEALGDFANLPLGAAALERAGKQEEATLA